MRPPRSTLATAAIGGLLLACVAAAWTGWPDVAAALRDLGWSGVVWLCVLQMAALALCALAWWIVTPDVAFGACVAARWVRDGAANLTVLPGLGEVAGARALRLFGAGSAAAAASTVVDVATESLAQAVYTVVGAMPLLWTGPARWTEFLVLSCLAALVPVAAVLVVTRHAASRAAASKAVVAACRVFGKDVEAAVLDLGRTVERLQGRRVRVLSATLIHLAAWFMGAVQVWAAAAAMSIDLSPGGALALESLVYAARGALFMVPAGAGIQEAGFVLVGAVLGIGEAGALALSVALRLRDLLLGLPAVVVWLVAEGRSGRGWIAGGRRP